MFIKKHKTEIHRIIVLILCFLLFIIIPRSGKASDTNQLRQELEAQINQLQQTINQYNNNVSKNQQKAKSLENEINILEDQISSIRLEIKQIDLAIQENNLNLQDINEKIDIIETQINIKKDILAEYIRLVEEYDKDNLLEIVLKNDSLADFFNEINALENAQQGLQDALQIIQALKTDLIEQKEDQETERAQQYQLRSLQDVQRKNVAYQQNKKEGLLKETRGEEEMYQSLIKNAQSDISHIREQLSLLDKYNITLEDAVHNAIFAASRTGIRPSFLLGVLEAESRLGLNVGTGNWKKDMYQCYQKLGYLTKSEKEKSAFFQICDELALNPDLQPVSAEPWYGCGGAMGVAQFMPTTWMAYHDRVASLTGHNPPNPWNHLDAFMAAAIKLSDGGANQRTETGERMAYGKYLGGNNYKKWMHHKVTNYVIQLADNFQKEYFN